MRARADNTPDGITVIMPVIYVLHTHARPPLFAPLNSPRGGMMNTLLSKHARSGVVWSPPLPGPASWDHLVAGSYVERVGLMGSDTGGGSMIDFQLTVVAGRGKGRDDKASSLLVDDVNDAHPANRSRADWILPRLSFISYRFR